VSVNTDASVARSSVRLSKTRGGERTWTILVACDGDDADGLRSALGIARELDVELAHIYAGEVSAKGGTHDDEIF
jgi:hypothetical protein